MHLDDLDDDSDSLKEHRRSKGLCMDCGKSLRCNRYRCPSCCRRVKDVMEYEVVFARKAVNVR